VAKWARTVEGDVLPLPVLDVRRAANYFAKWAHAESENTDGPVILALLRVECKTCYSCQPTSRTRHSSYHTVGPANANDGSAIWTLVFVIEEIGFALRVASFV